MSRSRALENYYFAVVVKKIVEKFIELGNGDTTKKDVHELMAEKFLIEETFVDGEVIQTPKEYKSIDNDVDLTLYVERVRHWAAEIMDVDTPNPIKGYGKN